ERRERLEHRREREWTPLPGRPVDRVVPGAAGVLGRDDCPVPRDDRRGVPGSGGRAGGGGEARQTAEGAGSAGGRAPGGRAAVAPPVRDGPLELHRGAGRLAAALSGRERPRTDPARSARRGREPLQGARRRLGDVVVDGPAREERDYVRLVLLAVALLATCVTVQSL